MPMPKKSEEEKASIRLQVRATPVQAQSLEDNARAADLSVSKYLLKLHEAYPSQPFEGKSEVDLQREALVRAHTLLENYEKLRSIDLGLSKKAIRDTVKRVEAISKQKRASEQNEPQQATFFIWDSVKCLRRYGDGKVVAMANNVDGAIQASIEAYLRILIVNYLYTPEEILEKLGELQVELRASKPYNTQKAMAVVSLGSE